MTFFIVLNVFIGGVLIGMYVTTQIKKSICNNLNGKELRKNLNTMDSTQSKYKDSQFLCDDVKHTYSYKEKGGKRS